MITIYHQTQPFWSDEMKSKLDLAHDYAMGCLRHLNQMKLNCCEKKLSAEAWKYADAMQAEADKRNQDSQSLTKDQEGNCLHFHHEFGHKKCMDCGASLEDWQPDWSRAPDDCNYWFISDSVRGVAAWSKTIPCYKGDSGLAVYGSNIEAPPFDYQGNWQDSLRERPEGK